MGSNKSERISSGTDSPVWLNSGMSPCWHARDTPANRGPALKRQAATRKHGREALWVGVIQSPELMPAFPGIVLR
jgi:hypothetical protein